MARRPYAGTATDYVMNAQGDPLPGRDEQGNVLVSGTAWDAVSGGTQVTDLQNLDGSAITGGVLVPDQNGRLPRFLGPDPDVAGRLWLDFGTGRYLFLATDLPDRIGALETGGVQAAGQQYPATAVVYSSTFRSSRPVTNAGQYTWTCDGVSDQTEINAAITAVSASGTKGGKVLLLGNLFNISGSIQLRTGVALEGEGLGTRILAASNFGAGMVTLLDNAVHATHLSKLTLDGTSKNVSGIHYSQSGGEIFNVEEPRTNPDPAHWISELLILSMGNSTAAGYGMRMSGGNLRAGKYTDIRILNASGCGIWVDGGVDSVYQDIEVGSCGDTTLGYSTSTTAPLGHGVFINQGDNNHWSNVKPWFSKGTGFYVRATRNSFIGCEAQDNHGHGFHFAFGKNIASACMGDSNGQGLGTTGGGGRAGFYASSDSMLLIGCTAFDRGRNWQNYGFEFGSGFLNSRVTGCLTFTNLLGSQQGTIPTSSTVDIKADANGR